MKKRTGFVSNSSSSSFIFSKEKYSKEFIINFLENTHNIKGYILEEGPNTICIEGEDFLLQCLYTLDFEGREFHG